MFGLNPAILYLLIALLAGNGIFAALWQFADSRADKQEALVVACQAKHDAFVEQTEALGEIAKAKAKIKERQNAQIAEDTSNGWAAALSRVRDIERDKRMRDAARRSAGGSGVSAPAQDRPGDARTGPDTVPSPARVAADCAETTITLNYLQSYVERLQNE
jgi:hypothetical protein